MENLPSWFVVAAFVLGTLVGGLLVTLKRQCDTDRIKRDFEEQLAAVVRDEMRDLALERERGACVHANEAPSEPETSSEIPEEDVTEWEHLPVPARADAARTHVAM